MPLRLDNAIPDGAGAPEDEIEITDEMMRAGFDAAVETVQLDLTEEELKTVLRVAYAAMLRAR